MSFNFRSSLQFIGITILGGAFSGAYAKDVDWSKCDQPDRSSTEYESDLSKQIETFTSSAIKTYPNSHIAVALNRYYGHVVGLRREFLKSAYLPTDKRIKPSDCALAKKDYRQTIILRDASYHIMCRSEAAAGGSRIEQYLKAGKTVAFATGYDALKLFSDPRHTKDFPTTPPGGFKNCIDGAMVGLGDPVPTKTQIEEFKTRLELPDSEVEKIESDKKEFKRKIESFDES